VNHIHQWALAASDEDFKEMMDHLHIRHRVDDLSDQGEFFTLPLEINT
jgi:hypothetical protein